MGAGVSCHTARRACQRHPGKGLGSWLVAGPAVKGPWSEGQKAAGLPHQLSDGCRLAVTYPSPRGGAAVQERSLLIHIVSRRPAERQRPAWSVIDTQQHLFHFHSVFSIAQADRSIKIKTSFKKTLTADPAVLALTHLL